MDDRRVTAGKPNIEDSSLMVPLSESTQRAFFWQVDVVVESERLTESDGRQVGRHFERFETFAGPRMGGYEDRLGPPVPNC